MAATAPPKRKPVAECDKVLCKPGTLFELETVEIEGRPTTVWKNVSTPRTVERSEPGEATRQAIVIPTPNA